MVLRRVRTINLSILRSRYGVVTCLVLVLCLVMGSSVALAEVKQGAEDVCLAAPFAESCQVVKIDAILVTGLLRTKRHVVTRELLFDEGDYASLEQIQESMQRLRNLGIFRHADFELVSHKVPLPDGSMPRELNPKRPSRVLKIKVDERWTLLPFGSFVQGGGLTSGSAGLFDVNLFGRYLEAGFQYSRLGESDSFWRSGGAANSFMVWFVQNRFMDTYTRMGVDLRRALRQRRVYTEAGDVEGGFTLERSLATLHVNREMLRWLRVGASLELAHDNFSSRFIDEESTLLQVQNFGGLPEDSRVYMLRWNMALGRLNSDDFYVDGWRVFGAVGHTNKVWGATQTFSDFDVTARYYKKLKWRGNLAMRAQLGMTNTDYIQYLNYMGGLNRVRGYRDSRFRGRTAWSVNAEYRVAPLATRWVVLQGVGFVDAGAVGERSVTIDRVDALSVGGGIRIISPKIYGLIMRADYAFPLTPGEPSRLSFGAGQFF